MKNKLKIFLLLTAFFACSQVFSPDGVHAQRRDNLTDKEIELVRDAQQIDLRMKIFVKAIDRRLLVINNDASQAKQVEKDIDTWGELPTGKRGELFGDIARILDEAISKIDDVAVHDMKSDFFPSAVHILADGAQKFLPELQNQLAKAADEKEKGAILNAVEFCNQIIEASAKVKRESPKEIKKRRDRDKEKETKDKPNTDAKSN